MTYKEVTIRVCLFDPDDPLLDDVIPGEICHIEVDGVNLTDKDRDQIAEHWAQNDKVQTEFLNDVIERL